MDAVAREPRLGNCVLTDLTAHQNLRSVTINAITVVAKFYLLGLFCGFIKIVNLRTLPDMRLP